MNENRIFVLQCMEHEQHLLRFSNYIKRFLYYIITKFQTQSRIANFKH